MGVELTPHLSTLDPEPVRIRGITMHRLAIEHDGRQHGLSLVQRERDVQRRERMEQLGWVFIVVTAAQLAGPREIVRRVRQVVAV